MLLDLVEGIMYIITRDKDEYKNLCLNSRRKAVKQFSLECVGQHYLKTYKEVSKNAKIYSHNFEIFLIFCCMVQNLFRYGNFLLTKNKLTISKDMKCQEMVILGNGPSLSKDIQAYKLIDKR